MRYDMDLYNIPKGVLFEQTESELSKPERSKEGLDTPVEGSKTKKTKKKDTKFNNVKYRLKR